MAKPVHEARPCRTALRGVEAWTLVSDQPFPRHAHDQFGIGVIADGAQRSWSGIGSVEAEAGDVITVNPGEMHDGSPVQGRTRTWRMLYLDPGLVLRSRPDIAAGDVDFAYPALRDPVLALRFARLFAAATAPAPDALEVEEGLLATVSHMLIKYGSRPARFGDTPPAVARALQQIDEAPALPVTLAALSARCGVSRFQLLRGFHRTVGITPHAYLLQQRVRLARRLLAAGGSPAQVATDAGFADQSHLTRAFRRQLGITPARYRSALA